MILKDAIKKAPNFGAFNVVPRTGVEPAHLAAPPPEDGASTNFATWARFFLRAAKIRETGNLNKAETAFFNYHPTPLNSKPYTLNP
jgi:hypothetical protein